MTLSHYKQQKLEEFRKQFPLSTEHWEKLAIRLNECEAFLSSTIDETARVAVEAVREKIEKMKQNKKVKEKDCKHSWTEWEGKWSCQLCGKSMTKQNNKVREEIFNLLNDAELMDMWDLDMEEEVIDRWEQFIEKALQAERERVVAKSSWKEIRIIDGNCDDIVISDVDAHLEDMTGNFWWLGLYRGNKRTTFHIISKSKIKVKVIENDLKCKFVDQPELSSKHDTLTHAK